MVLRGALWVPRNSVSMQLDSTHSTGLCDVCLVVSMHGYIIIDYRHLIKLNVIKKICIDDNNKDDNNVVFSLSESSLACRWREIS